jgi:hypothetical protein
LGPPPLRDAAHRYAAGDEARKNGSPRKTFWFSAETEVSVS